MFCVKSWVTWWSTTSSHIALLSPHEVRLSLINELLKDVLWCTLMLHLSTQIETYVHTVLWRKSQDKSDWISAPSTSLSSIRISFQSTFLPLFFHFAFISQSCSLWFSSSAALIKHSFMDLPVDQFKINHNLNVFQCNPKNTCLQVSLCAPGTGLSLLQVSRVQTLGYPVRLGGMLSPFSKWEKWGTER